MLAFLTVFKTRTNKFYIFRQCTYIVYIMKKKLKGEGQQFHQYQIKRIVSSHLKSLNITKIPRHMTLEIQILAWNRHTHVAGFFFLIRTQD